MTKRVGHNSKRTATAALANCFSLADDNPLDTSCMLLPDGRDLLYLRRFIKVLFGVAIQLNDTSQKQYTRGLIAF